MKTKHIAGVFACALGTGAALALIFTACPGPIAQGNTPPPATYTVTFDSNDGSAVAPLTGVPKGTTITKPTDPTRLLPPGGFGTSYVLGGWYKDVELTAPWNFGADTVTEPITLYAKWTGGKTYDLSGFSGTLIDKALAWLTTGAEANTAYDLCLNAGIPAQPPQTLNDAAFHDKSGVTLTITTPDADPLTVEINGTGSLFTLDGRNPKTLVLDGAVVLKGKADNTAALLTIGNSPVSTLKLNGSAEITGNTRVSSYEGGGVHVWSGTFIMNGGKIHGNSAGTYAGSGGGVFIDAGGSAGIFEMNGGVICDNTALIGGGVCINDGKFVMNGGVIVGKTDIDTTYKANHSDGDSHGSALKNDGAAVFGSGGGYVGATRMAGGADIDNVPPDGKINDTVRAPADAP